jgi:hypothetical protein
MTQPKEVPAIVIHTTVKPQKDPVFEQDSKNEDGEFHRIKYEQELKENFIDSMKTRR